MFVIIINFYWFNCFLNQAVTQMFDKIPTQNKIKIFTLCSRHNIFWSRCLPESIVTSVNTCRSAVCVAKNLAHFLKHQWIFIFGLIGCLTNNTRLLCNAVSNHSRTLACYFHWLTHMALEVRSFQASICPGKWFTRWGDQLVWRHQSLCEHVLQRLSLTALGAIREPGPAVRGPPGKPWLIGVSSS